MGSAISSLRKARYQRRRVRFPDRVAAIEDVEALEDLEIDIHVEAPVADGPGGLLDGLFVQMLEVASLHEGMEAVEESAHLRRSFLGSKGL